MIEKLHSHFIKADDGLGIIGILKPPSTAEIVDKLNEIIDVVNDFEATKDNDSIPGDTIVPIWNHGKIQVLIDDAELIMERVLSEYLGAEILSATVTLPIEEVKKDNG